MRGKGFRGVVDHFPKHKQDSRDGLFRAEGLTAGHCAKPGKAEAQ